MRIGIFHGSTTGTTEAVAERIARAFSGADVTCRAISETSPEDLLGYDVLILGSSTWGDGQLQDDWQAFLPSLREVDLAGATVAVFGVGDQEGWPDTFVDAMGILHESIFALGAELIGRWPTDGYEFEASRAVVDSAFVGLAVDETNQADRTNERVEAWARLLREECDHE